MAKRKILLVDDEKTFTEMLSLNLECTGMYETKVENNAGRALTTALAYRPDLILLDVIMTHRKGTDLVPDFEQDERLRNIPIVFLTATVSEDSSTVDTKEFRGRPFISKPTDFDVLLRAIGENLSTAC